MFRILLAVGLWLAFVSTCPAVEATDCVPEREQLLAMSQDAFDQNLGHGWREVADRPGCGLAAADLLRDYRQAHPQSPNTQLLYWHEAQLRAFAGDSAVAIELMGQSRAPGAEDQMGWNPYVDATIAFLRGDADALRHARDVLAAVPPSPDLPAPKDGYIEMKTPKGGLVRMRWPMNLDVVDGLVRCLGRPYVEAYGQACRVP